MLEILKNELIEAQKKVKKFEDKYNKDLSTLESEGVGTSMEEHDDYMEWLFWQSTVENARKIIKKYESFYS